MTKVLFVMLLSNHSKPKENKIPFIYPCTCMIYIVFCDLSRGAKKENETLFSVYKISQNKILDFAFIGYKTWGTSLGFSIFYPWSLSLYVSQFSPITNILYLFCVINN